MFVIDSGGGFAARQVLCEGCRIGSANLLGRLRRRVDGLTAQREPRQASAAGDRDGSISSRIFPSAQAGRQRGSSAGCARPR